MMFELCPPSFDRSSFLRFRLGGGGRGGPGAPGPASSNAAQLISHIDYDSPASRVGLSAGDEVLSSDGVRVTNIEESLRGRKAGERIRAAGGAGSAGAGD